MSKLRNTIDRLKLCIAAENAGHVVSYTTSSRWLVNMAINRRAGWKDDPTHCRGSAMPVAGKYPAKASGDAWHHLRQLADRINTPRLRVYESELGEWRKLLLKRLPQRFVMKGEEHD